MSKDARRDYLRRLYRFVKAWTYLRDWYCDGGQVRARGFAGAGTPTSDPTQGDVVLRCWKYPGPNWVAEWNAQKNNPAGQEAILRALEEEIYGLTHSPSLAGPASGLHKDTAEWRLAVATADGSLRAVARRFGISHTEVRRLRMQHEAPS